MIQKVAILMSFIGLWISSFLSNNQEFYIGFSLILTFGILHGANDFFLIDCFSIKSDFTKKLLYVFSIILFSLFFFLFPKICFVFFILASSFHFGEQHYIELEIKSDRYQYFTKFNIGFFILNLIFINNPIMVIDIFNKITSIHITKTIIIFNVSLSFIIFVIHISFLLYKKRIHLEKIIQFLISLIFLVIIFKISSLVWGFTIYFVFWHSIPSIVYQVEFIYKEINLKNIILYFKKALLFWILAIISLCYYYQYYNKSEIFEIAFFSFISAITFPHTIVIVKMFTYKKLEL